ncbi:MAG: PilZ domain-containing protein [Methyloligellaceae bacterium]
MASHNKRLEDRKACFVHAFASDIEETLDVKCIIRDISEKGCRIVSSQIHELPDEIHLTPEDFDRPLRGKIVWRRRKSAGVLLCSTSEHDEVQQKVDALLAKSSLDDDDDEDDDILLLALEEKPPTFGERLKRFIPRRRRW